MVFPLRSPSHEKLQLLTHRQMRMLGEVVSSGSNELTKKNLVISLCSDKFSLTFLCPLSRHVLLQKVM